jgi:hypothetical protein
MSALVRRPPNKLVAPLLDWRARRIPDPIARLRFLRTATTTLSASVAGRRSFRGHVVLAALVIVATAIAVPYRTVVSAAYNGGSRIRAPRGASDNTPQGNGIWQVESTAEFEVYSNGLRIEKTYATPNRPRPHYRVFRRDAPGMDGFQWRENIAGIVFHTTESHLAPFLEHANDRLRRASRNVLAEVQIRRCYNYVIDRFGRVWRIVEESDVAWHAGNSIWADASGVYVNLNDSFLGISFEAKTQPGDQQSIATEAQLQSAKLLTAMLRAKYNIPAENCTTHAQVSVNNSNMRHGYHTDWASAFPFAAIGLPDNYAQSLPSLWTFGFDYDQSFIRATGNTPWPGLTLADQHIREQAALAGITAAQYKLQLRQRYKQLLATLYGAGEEPANES